MFSILYYSAASTITYADNLGFPASSFINILADSTAALISSAIHLFMISFYVIHYFRLEIITSSGRSLAISKQILKAEVFSSLNLNELNISHEFASSSESGILIHICVLPVPCRRN